MWRRSANAADSPHSIANVGEWTGRCAHLVRHDLGHVQLNANTFGHVCGRKPAWLCDADEARCTIAASYGKCWLRVTSRVRLYHIRPSPPPRRGFTPATVLCISG